LDLPNRHINFSVATIISYESQKRLQPQWLQAFFIHRNFAVLLFSNMLKIQAADHDAHEDHATNDR
jgi:hypothetical protein